MNKANNSLKEAEIKFYVPEEREHFQKMNQKMNSIKCHKKFRDHEVGNYSGIINAIKVFFPLH